jgi:hypothetical protein
VLETNNENPSLPGLVQWLEKLHLDPAAPRFRGETVSRANVNLGRNVVGAHSGSSARLNLSGGYLKRRTKFWRTQSVRQTYLDSHRS